jgi:hypothetical protein
MSDEPERPFAPAQYARFAEYDPDETDGETLTWYVRGQNLVVAYTEGDEGAVLTRDEQPDEYVVLLPDPQCGARVRAAEHTAQVPCRSLAVVPPGPSEVRLEGRMAVVRFFTTRSRDLADRCSNAGDYTETYLAGDERPDGLGMRCYSLDGPPDAGGLGRIWSCTTLTVSYPESLRGPADPTALAPHRHPDAEQCALALRGAFVHHVRWPWTKSLEDWREDEHERCGTPSVAIFPPGTIHATQAVGPGINELVEVFCPPAAGVP